MKLHLHAEIHRTTPFVVNKSYATEDEEERTQRICKKISTKHTVLV